MELLLFFIFIVLLILLLIQIKSKFSNFYENNINSINLKITFTIILSLIFILLSRQDRLFHWCKESLMLMIFYGFILFIIEINFKIVKDLVVASIIPQIFLGKEIFSSIVYRNDRLTEIGKTFILSSGLEILLILTIILSYKEIKNNKSNKFGIILCLLTFFFTLKFQFNLFQNYIIQNKEIKIIEKKRTLEDFFKTMDTNTIEEVQEKKLLNEKEKKVVKELDMTEMAYKTLKKRYELTPEENKKLEKYMKELDEKDEFRRMLKETVYKGHLLRNR